MQNIEIEKSKSHKLSVSEIIEYVPDSAVSKTIARKTTGSMSVVTIDTFETLTAKILPFSTFIQVIEGKAEVLIDTGSNILQASQAIIIPGHTS